MNEHRPGITWRECLLHAFLFLAPLPVLFPGVFLRGELIAPGYVLLEFLPWKAHGAIDWPTAKNLLTWEFLGVFTGWYSIAETSLTQGEWPLWNPLELTGLPLLANYQSAVLYPLRLLHGVMDLHTASTLHILLKLWLCGFNAYLCGRGMGLSRAVSRFFAFAWMLCTFHITWCFWAELDEGAWFPLVFLACEWLVVGRHRRGFFLLLASGTLLLLAGHPESAFTLSAGAGIYFFLRLLLLGRKGRALWLPIVLAGSAWGVALLVCAALILPFFEYVFVSHRTAMESGEHALTPGVLINFLVPRFYGMTSEDNFWGRWNSNFTAILYPGLAVWIGALLAFSRSRNPKIRGWRTAVCLLIPGLFSGLMLLGHPSVAFIRRIPPFGTTWEAWYTPAVMFSAILIAAIGFERWFAQRRKLREMLWLIPVAVLVGAPVVWFYFFNKPTMIDGLDRYVANQLWIAAAFATAGLAVIAVSCVWYRPRLLMGVVTVLLAADLLVAGRGLLPTTPRERLWPRTELTDYLASIDPPPRVGIKSATIANGLMQYYGIEQWQGYDGIYPKRFRRFFDEIGSDLWNAMTPACAVRYYLHLPELHPFFPRDDRGGFELAAAMDGLEVYEDTMAFPRAYLVGHAKVVPDIDEMIAIMRSPEYDPGKVALIEAPLATPLPEPEDEDFMSGNVPVRSAEGTLGNSPAADSPAANDTGAASDVSTPGDEAATPALDELPALDPEVGQATFIGRTMNTAQVKATVNKDAILVLADAYFPGWHAHVTGEVADVDGHPVHIDSRDVEIFPVYSVFRGIRLRPGEYTITYEYRPLSFRLGLAISTVTLLIGAAAALQNLLRRPRHRR